MSDNKIVNGKSSNPKSMAMFPEVWDELTREDYVSMLKLRDMLLTNPPANIDVDDIRIEAARCLLLNRGIRTRMSDDKYFLLVRQCGAKLDWLWQETEEGGVALVYRSTVNPLDKFGQLYGPMSHGADLVFGEFKEALALCKAYDKDENHPMELLQQLAGLLYRRRGYKSNGKKQVGRRIAYDIDGADAQLTRGRRMPRWFVWGVYAWFSFFCEYLATGVFIIDGREVSFKSVFGGGRSSDGGNEGLGLNSIALTLAESGVFGGFDDVLHTPLMRVMMKMLHDHESYERTRKEFKTKQL